MDHQKKLRDFKPEHDYFIGIDSDGCVFDTMEIKQKQFFIPNAIKYFGLSPVENTVKETWEFVNLYSVFRGGNRFTSLIRVFDYLRERVEIGDAGIKLPKLESLKEWTGSETRLSNEKLRKFTNSKPDPELELVLQWSENINKEIEEGLRRIPPFPSALKALKMLSLKADIVIVSQTPLEALEREWEENDILKYVRLIAGQEHGTKAEHIKYAAGNKYPENKIMMIGDAEGDLAAALQNKILFYPIIPGKEDISWKKFLTESADKFFSGSYSGDYEKKLCDEFQISLPKEPFWH
jgi:phosphoglycolate phosphatase-like HAD superfamily hydrolase